MGCVNHLLHIVWRVLHYFLSYILPGLIVTYNLRNDPYDRVVSVEVRCKDCPVPDYEPLELTQMYTIVAPAYIADGGDGYTMIAENRQNYITGKSYNIDIIIFVMDMIIGNSCHVESTQAVVV